MSILEKFKMIFKVENDNSNIGCAWITEVLPMYSDHANSTNKTLWVIKDVLSENIVKAFDLNSYGYISYTDKVLPKKVLTQDGIPIKFNKKGNPINNNINFEKNGYKQNDIYFFNGLGYLGNIETYKKVWIVLDDYIVFKYIESNSFSISSFRELEKLKPTYQGRA